MLLKIWRKIFINKGVNQLVIGLVNEKLREQGKEEIPTGMKDVKAQSKENQPLEE